MLLARETTKEKQRKTIYSAAADLHCHILPCIDDGACSSEESEQMIKEEQKQNIRYLAFSPHYYPDRMPFDVFLQMRDKAYENLKGPDNKVWAEVRIHPDILELDLKKLALNDTYILLEFPYGRKPLWGAYVVEQVIAKGFVPVLAHIERFPYLSFDELHYFKKQGCVLQCNTGLLLKNRYLYREYFEAGMVDIIASDAHNMIDRVPNLQEAYQMIGKMYGDDIVEMMAEKSMDIWMGKHIL